MLGNILRTRIYPLRANLNANNLLFHTARATFNSSPVQDNEGRHNVTLERIKKQLEADKAALKWRTPHGDAPEDWNSKLKLLADSEQTSDYIVMMQQPLDFSPKAVKKWLARRRERTERFMQQYVSERHEKLGPELAAAHFILYRGGAAKFLNSDKWMRADENNEFNLPNRFHPDYKVEALRCDNMKLYYEGLENIRCLQYLKFLSFHNITNFDDWCLDRVSGSQYPTLEILDISGTKCTYRGLSCLYRLPTLQLLIVDDPKQSVQYELSCAMLEEAIPKLKIISAVEMHGDKKS